ncbi:type II secretion system minor pseudopilin GspK [Thiothrix nivea]|uniref:General secretion pathway protein K n=1 Tax=Thiothrix nivea (strain ATCC 35100 / DSM 5205 / JP2) TaxID=870187 RepID=A0A656HI72_THINJ|nr:type II secretion system minor pseudopilin GspK [Thiothrix nivea]EIJ35196.1 general secretion pathway protein K [Thiothrix nivea DSM 5205]
MKPRPLRNNLNLPQRQRGIAILTVLVIAVLVVTLAAVVFARQSRAVRQSDNFQSLERAWQYVFTMEQYAGLQLQLDAQENKYDAFTDRWAYELPTQTLREDSGAVVQFKGKLEDMQGRFNLNNLVLQKEQGQGQGQASGQQQQAGEQAQTTQSRQQQGYNGAVYGQLQKFVTAAGLPVGFAEAIVDWVDANNLPTGVNGAERDYYLSGAIPYLAADMPFADLSEVRLLRLDIPEPELKDKLLQRFLQTVTALPFYTTLNPNTASKEVLKASGLNDNQIGQILDKRKTKQAYKSKEEFSRDMAFTPGNDDVLMESFDVTSQYFRLSGEVHINRARVFVNSLLFRAPNGPVRVIMRQFDRVDEQPTTTDDASNTPAITE